MAWAKNLITVVAVAASAIALGSGVVRAAEPIDFAHDVRPILQSRCFACHGEEAQEGNLRLDRHDDALRGGDSGALFSAGSSATSAIIERVISEDPDLRMPQDGKPLSADEIAILKRWIDEGAKWPDDVAVAAAARDHWSLRPLLKPEIPESKPEIRNPVDAFVRAKLTERMLSPSPSADRRTLIRRVTYDLTGLPPTPEEVDAFVADADPAAYEKLVNRLLASPRYGERWARHWIDVAHWAETHGHDQDRPRPNAWPYRDYLIQSFNADKPYAHFVAEQIAGDVLFPEDPQATVALGFLASGPWDESSLMGIQDDTVDRKLGQVLDRDDIITTVMSTFSSATVHCARCHNHKFDPIAQADYYALQAVFAGVDRTERPFDKDAATSLKRQSLVTRKQELQSRADEWFTEPVQQSLAAEIEPRFAHSGENWRVLSPTAFQAVNGSTSAAQSDGSFLFTGKRPETETYTYAFEGDFRGATALQLETLADANLPSKGPGRQDNGNFHLSEIGITIGPATDAAPAAAPIATAMADFNQADWGIERAIDGVDATAWGIYPEVSKSHAAVFVFKEAIAVTGQTRLTVTLKQLHGTGHLIGRPRLSLTSSTQPGVLKPIPAELGTALATPAESRSVEQRIALNRFLLSWDVDHQLSSLPAPQQCYAIANRATSNGNPIVPPAEPRVVHMLRRGDINQPLEVATAGTISCLEGLPARFTLANATDEGTRRAALAEWLIQPDNVLTWRSIVNRVWHYHFGKGIVDTPNDLGKMGGTPSHPELLDWLAVELRDSGGSLKRLHKLLVTSETYCQSSDNVAEFAQIDGVNRLLWRMNSTRLDAESIRDSLLAVSGKLDLTMGGPSVKQFVETPGIHVTPNVDYQGFNIDAPEQNRRAIYRFLFRTLPDPFMASMDCPDASQWSPTRTASVTALQALSMLNNRFLLRQSELTAERLIAQSNEPPAQIKQLFQLALSREPSAEEATRWQEYATKHGLANACRMMFNTNEFMFVR